MILDDNYKIESEDRNVILYKKRIPKEGKTKGQVMWDSIGYHANIKQALKKYCNIQLNNSLDDFTTVMAKYDELMTTIERVGG